LQNDRSSVLSSAALSKSQHESLCSDCESTIVVESSVNGIVNWKTMGPSVHLERR